MITRLYDDSKTFFHAVKHANKGAIRGAFKNLGKVKLLDASKAIQKIKKDKKHKRGCGPDDAEGVSPASLRASVLL